MTVDEAIKDFEQQNRLLLGIRTTSSQETAERNLIAIEILKRTRWISVSERLPKMHKEPYYSDEDGDLYESDEVLVCFRRENGSFGQCVTSLVYCVRDNTYEWADLYDLAMFEVPQKNAVAWMPLPEPYKTESEGKE